MSKEIMQQALDMLVEPHPHIRTSFTDSIKYREKINQVIEALRQALAQPEQEPFKPDWVSYRQGVADGAAQHEQDYIKKLENDFCEQLDQLSERNYKLRMELADAKLAQPEPICRDDGRCQYAIDHGAEGMGHCPVGKCCMPQNEQEPEPVAWLVSDAQGRYATIRDPAPYGEEKYEPLYVAPLKREQERLSLQLDVGGGIARAVAACGDQIESVVLDLPKRAWVGLTNLDMPTIRDGDHAFWAGAQFADAWLKEKNT